MNLIDLQPQWLWQAGRIAGLVLFCPHCVAQNKKKPTPLSCFCIPSPKIYGWPVSDRGGQMGLFDDICRNVDAYKDYDCGDFVPSKEGFAWSFSNTDNFATLSITPSLDASASGHWHGFVTNGQTGG